MPSELHHYVRERFGETLCYFFLSFDGTYDFDEGCKLIASFFEREGIKTYALFETFGNVDIIIRAWMPNTVVNILDRRLDDYLVPHRWKLTAFNSFRVSTNRYHYLWREGSPSGREALLDNLTVGQVNDAGSQKLLMEAGLLKEMPPPTQGNIALFISIPSANNNPHTQDRIVAELARILKAHPFGNTTLYEGLGNNMAILLDASVPPAEFFQISNFNQKINALGFQTFGLKTTTFLATGRQRESSVRAIVSTADAVEAKTVIDYLSAEESAQLEHKGSFSVDIKGYLTGENVQNQNKDMQQRLQNEVLHTIAAFLNSDGGELVIGAVEEAKFRNEHLAKLQEFPAVANMRILGIELEYLIPRDKNWDGYERRLLDIIREKIGPGYTNLIKVRRLTFVSDDADKKTWDLCLIRVAKLPGRQAVYFGGKQFFIRNGSQTLELPPAQIPAYLSRKPV